MTARHLVSPMFIVSILCPLCPAAPPEGKGGEPKEPKVEGKPVLKPLWKKTTVGLEKAEDINADKYAKTQQSLADRYAEVVKTRQTVGKPLISPATPKVAGNQIIYYSDRGLVAVRLREQRREEMLEKQGDLLWHLRIDRSLCELAQWEPVMSGDWFKRHSSESLADFLCHRTLATAFSVTGDQVFFLDELGILPPVDLVSAGYGFGPLDVAFSRNIIFSGDLETGKLLSKCPTDLGSKAPLSRLYCSVPFVENELYFAVSRPDEAWSIRCFSLRIYQESQWLPEAERQKISTIWGSRGEELELLGFLSRRVTYPNRVHAIHLVRHGDKLISPTNAGMVNANDVATGKHVWKHMYGRSMARKTFVPEWVVVPPVVVGDKYIYAPADFPELFCLNVDDGKKVWSLKKGDGLYPAVVGEQVLVIGEKTLRSLNVKDGTERWKLNLPGVPCGRGAMLGETYLLPVSEPKTWRGMIAMIDVKNGKITEVLKPEKDEPIGNLVVHQEFLISQTLTEIAVFPIRK